MRWIFLDRCSGRLLAVRGDREPKEIVHPLIDGSVGPAILFRDRH